MALIECPECAHQVSRQAVACPSCGHPIRPPQASPPRTVRVKRSGSGEELVGFALIALGMVAGIAGFTPVGAALFFVGLLVFIVGRFQ